MPDRPTLYASFLIAPCLLGMNIPITDPTNMQLRAAVLAGDVFLGHDRRTRHYMQSFRQKLTLTSG
jgi:hypothetical protein